MANYFRVNEYKNEISRFALICGFRQSASKVTQLKVSNMKFIKTTPTTISKIKADAKKIKKTQDITLANALEATAIDYGYESYHHATECAKQTEEQANTTPKSSYWVRIFKNEKQYRVETTNPDLLDFVTQSLDDFLEENYLDSDEFTIQFVENRRALVQLCKRLVKKEPCFIDGYAHLAGALVSLERHDEAVTVAEPVLEEIFNLFATAPKSYKPSYYDLPNRPFFRLAHHLVLAYFGQGENDKAINLSKKMLKLWPTDNIGFRFLLSPETD